MQRRRSGSLKEKRLVHFQLSKVNHRLARVTEDRTTTCFTDLSMDLAAALFGRLTVDKSGKWSIFKLHLYEIQIEVSPAVPVRHAAMAMAIIKCRAKKNAVPKQIGCIGTASPPIFTLSTFPPLPLAVRSTHKSLARHILSLASVSQRPSCLFRFLFPSLFPFLFQSPFPSPVARTTR